MRGRRHARRLQYIGNMPESERTPFMQRVASGAMQLLSTQAPVSRRKPACKRFLGMRCSSSFEIDTCKVAQQTLIINLSFKTHRDDSERLLWAHWERVVHP